MAQAKKKTQTKTKKPPTQSQMAVRRKMWGAGYIFCAFLWLLSLLNVEGFVLKGLKSLTMGIMGIGFYIFPAVLFISGAVLIKKSKGKARKTVALTMSLPFVLGIIGHEFSKGSRIPFDSYKELWNTGIAGQSGGVVSGFFGSLLAMAISPIGGAVVAVLLLLAILIFAYNINIVAVVENIRLPKEQEEEPQIQEAVSGGFFHRKKIDIALDGEDKKIPKIGEKIEIAPPNVKTPAEILKGQGKAEGIQDRASKGVEAVADEQNLDEELVFDYALPKHTDGLMREAEISDKILADRDDAVKPFKSGPIEIPPLARPMGIAPSVTDTSVSAKVKNEETDDVAKKISQEIEEMMQKHSESDTNEYLYPPISLLKRSPPVVGDPEGETKLLSDKLVDTLLSFGVDTTVVGVTRGPTVTRYELVLQRGTKYSRVSNLSEDIALSLGAPSIRISTIPDKNAIGIEVPNAQQQMVTIRDILDSSEFKSHKSKICFPVGKDIANKNIVGDIGKMPHMLIAGTTGSGKSVCINSILISLLYKASPEEVRIIMIDPKMIELGVYNGIPHLLIPVVTDPKKASGALNWAVSEMLRRYRLLSEMGVRDLASYNEEVKSRGEGERLPQIVIVIDELADLMFVAAREVEEAIARIAQMARAAGMHLIIATQRPSADIITGIMKANIPSRVAFAVASQIESRIILDTMGAEKLIGKGDMLYAPLGLAKPMRVQGCFITTSEVESVVEFIKKTSTADYKSDIMEHIENAAENTGKGSQGANMSNDSDDDPLMNDAIQIVVETGQASTSMLQRRLKLGYSRASRLIDQMEERGIVGPFEGSKPRQVMISKTDWQEMVLRGRQN